MNAILNEKARIFYLDKLRAILEGEVSIPELWLERYATDPEVMHCSEGELCPARAYYRRTVTPAPPLSDRAILTFMRGRLFERILADEQPSVTLDGISGRVDGLYEGQLIETKATTQDAQKFNPHISQPHWIQRSMAYCKLHGKTEIILVVWFLLGAFWSTHKPNPELKCWTLTFTPHEIDETWKKMLIERERLMACLRTGGPVDWNWIRMRVKPYECPDCSFREMCDYPNKGDKK